MTVPVLQMTGHRTKGITTGKQPIETKNTRHKEGSLFGEKQRLRVLRGFE
jgi:hypothetical protein